MALAAAIGKACTGPPNKGAHRLSVFSSERNATVLRGSSPLYEWKVTRRDRAVASGAAGGPPTGLRTEASQASPMAGDVSAAIGEGAGRGWDRAAAERHEA